MTPQKQKTPTAGQSGEGQQSSRTNVQHQPTAVVARRPRATERAVRSLDGAVAVLVTETIAGTTRRTVFLTLPSATAAQERATARGNRATVVVCQLQPLDGIEVDA